MIKLIDFCGNNYDVLVPAAEWLAYQDETVVRDKGIECLAILCGIEDVGINFNFLKGGMKVFLKLGDLKKIMKLY